MVRKGHKRLQCRPTKPSAYLLPPGIASCASSQRVSKQRSPTAKTRPTCSAFLQYQTEVSLYRPRNPKQYCTLRRHQYGGAKAIPLSAEGIFYSYYNPEKRPNAPPLSQESHKEIDPQVNKVPFYTTRHARIAPTRLPPKGNSTTHIGPTKRKRSLGTATRVRSIRSTTSPRRSRVERYQVDWQRP